MCYEDFAQKSVGWLDPQRKQEAAAKSQTPPRRRGLLFQPEDSLLRRRNRIREDIRKRRGLLFLQLRMRERLARHHGLTLAGVVEEDCLEHRALLKIECVQAVEGIHVGVMGP